MNTDNGIDVPRIYQLYEDCHPAGEGGGTYLMQGRIYNVFSMVAQCPS